MRLTNPFNEVCSAPDLAQEGCQLLTVVRVLMNTKLDVLAEGFMNLLKVLLVFGEQFQGLLGQALLNNLENLVLLEGFTRDIQRKVLRVDNTLHKAQILRN